MKLAMFDDGSGPRSGVVVGEGVVPTGLPGALVDLMPQWEDVESHIKRAAETGSPMPLSKVKLLAPVSRPGKIFAIGLNYADHIAESKMGTPEIQVWFTKAVTSVNAPFDPIQIAKKSEHVDYEVELVAVIGTRARYVSQADATSYVFGYCVGNDVTERLWQHRTPQWSLGKSFDTHAPIGPWITTADEAGDPHVLGIRCFVNGEKRQDSNTRNLVFNVWEQIEHLSWAMTLEPGDLIFTGTPGGVGAAMNPRKFLSAGDVVRCEIDRLGTIEGRFVAAV
jgi:2-keto-4-pentenoate hydratase/2-oxohepta-3-ene-1,7-dioic acid hydratase in catechol pathway